MELSSEVTFERICEALGFAKSSSLLKEDSPAEVAERFKAWTGILRRFGIDAIFFIQTEVDLPTIPVVYFKKMEKYDEKGIADLHKIIWNQGKIPLLFVILPNEVRIYNCFEPPRASEDEVLDTERRLIGYLKTFSDIENIRRKLSAFTHDSLYSGRFWREKRDLFDLSNRADMHLLNNLRVVRRTLKAEGLNDKNVHRLIARSILILCLEDRGALREFFKIFKNGRYKGFREVIQNKKHVYNLFETINDHFNGDIFPITDEEREVVLSKHLRTLRNFLLGTDLETGQTRLWPYRFDFIPIEFISNIYEEFFQYERKPSTARGKRTGSLGTYYTPQFLVSFMLEGILSWDQHKSYPRVLDPSCGSGTFLVEAYRRIISQRIESEGNIEAKELKRILQDCVFGVDINKEAISITAFSLYLTMMDYVSPDSLWKQPKLFPRLVQINLFPVDFFDTFAQFNRMKFDVIIGNVPWISISKRSNTKALRYCRLSRRPVGDRQIAQAFLWKSLDLLNHDGEMCLIVGAKSLLFNRSDKNKLFRREFLRNSAVKTIVNLSALRQNLFNRSVGPAAIIYCKGKRDVTTEDQKSVLYVCPKASLETKYVGSIIIDKSDYARIPLELALDDDSIWKISFWGTPRDLELISKARCMGTLAEAIKRNGWVIGDGLQRGGGDRNFAPWLLEYRFIPTKSLSKYHIEKSNLERVTDPIFHRPRSKQRYAAPLCLFKVTLSKGELVSAYSSFDVAYTDGIIGISGNREDQDLLKILCCYLNSDIAKYFLFLTCSVWGVERDDILKDDLLNLPFVLPERNTEEFNVLLSVYDNISSVLKNGRGPRKIEIYEQHANSVFFELFNLTEIERRLISDTVNYTIDYFRRKDDSVATEPVSRDILQEYARNSMLLLESVTKGTDKAFHSRVYTGSEALKLVSFTLDSRSEIPTVEVITDSEELSTTLDDLLEYLQERRYKNVFLRRMMRVYESTTVFIIKPNEQRHWTRIEAYKDADDTLAEILYTWRGEHLA